MPDYNGETGLLSISILSTIHNNPIQNATVTVSFTGDPESPVEQLMTNESGQTGNLELPTPPLAYSMQPNEPQPYSEYTIHVEAPDFETVDVSGSELMSGTESLQTIHMNPITVTPEQENIVIAAHTLYAEYPEKIPEDEIKPINQTGEIVLSRVVIPEFIVVHDGSPDDTTAKNYYVRYLDYIKNVACGEIYATWPDSCIRANVLAIMSFTLNRVYTEWYRNKGYDFTITSSTAFDHKWIFGRNIFDKISRIVDEVYNNYLSRPNVKQPILTQYCDGARVQCPNWMTQWGSKDLADEGYSTIEILRYFYGDSIYINNAEAIAGIPASFPGYNLDIGASGDKVRQIQEQLNAISEAYPALPAVVPDGIYGEATQNAIRIFQRIFRLPVTGIVDYRTWYKIQEIFVGVTRIAELA